MRFVVMHEQDEQVVVSIGSEVLVSSGYRSSSCGTKLPPAQKNKRCDINLEAIMPNMETTFPASVSIDELLKAGK